MKKKNKSSSPPMYLESIFYDLPSKLEASLAEWLFENGCKGTQEVLDFSQPNLKYEATVKPQENINLSAFYEPAQRESVEPLISEWLRKNSPHTKLQWNLHATQDWLKEWKKHFKALTVGGLRIIPSWKLKKGQSLKKAIVIEPGMAFGTGTHATTRFALEILKTLSESDLKNKTVLDVGSGSGILAVACERFGARKILANDNDPEAWRECAKTFKLNKTKKCKVTKKQLHEIKSPSDIVIANIIDGVLMDLKDDLWRVVKKDGYLVLSGILADGASAFKKDFLEGKSGQILKEFSDGEWTALLISK